MSELGDLLELLHGAASRYSTLESRWRIWRHNERSRHAFAAATERRGGTSGSFGVGDPRDAPAEHEEELHFWLAAPDRMREEVHGAPGGDRLAIKVGETWWSYSAASGAMTNAGSPRHGHGVGQTLGLVLDPARLPGFFDFKLIGRGERIGREVLRATATPRSVVGRPAEIVMLELGGGCDELGLEVDAELGILLLLEERFAGEPYGRRQAIELAVDAQIERDLFKFASPDGEAPLRVDERLSVRHGMSLHEAAAAVPFTVYALPEVPRGWELDVTLHQPRARPPIPPVVHLAYRTRDAASHVSISQQAARGAEKLAIPEGEELTHEGRRLRVRRRTEGWPQAQVATELNGTLIVLTSQNRPTEDLIDIAGRLRPVGRAPTTHMPDGY